ncbi:hypothetical protein C2E23DRAFT_818997 [Lenzites betulinus]|nr:hypothetical protein C2E23DRAFT_818997 [Lenzites betulinus]
MKPFCSVQGYNVSAALRRWLRPGEDAQALAAEGPPALESIVVWTGKEEPVGLAEVASACESFGLAFAREIVHCA